MRNWKVYENETTPFGDWKILSCWRDEVLYYSEQNFTNTQRQGCASEDSRCYTTVSALHITLAIYSVEQQIWIVSYQFLFFRF